MGRISYMAWRFIMEVNGVDKAYSLVAEGELSTILSNFNSSYTYDVVDDLMRERYNSFSLISKPNFIDELEYSFKQLLDQFPSDKDNIIYTRNKTYLEIISRISNNSGVQFTIEDTDSVDIRYLASIIFDLFISNYNEYVFKFLYNFIVNQKDFIYNQLDLIKSKKSKDISTMYNRQYYSNDTLAIISAKLYSCIDFITALDFDSRTTLSYIYTSADEIVRMNYLLQYIDSSADLFRILILPILTNDLISPSLVNSVKMELQKNFTINKANIFDKQL